MRRLKMMKGLFAFRIGLWTGNGDGWASGKGNQFKGGWGCGYASGFAYGNCEGDQENNGYIFARCDDYTFNDSGVGDCTGYSSRLDFGNDVGIGYKDCTGSGKGRACGFGDEQCKMDGIGR